MLGGGGDALALPRGIITLLKLQLVQCCDALVDAIEQGVDLREIEADNDAPPNSIVSASWCKRPDL